jgi:hypothetical protein
MSDDPKITRRYRELPREEPPRHLDDAILAASRRATKSRPTRWYAAFAAAAVIVLAVAVTLHVEREQPIDQVAEAPVAAPPAVPSAPPREESPVVAQAPAEARKRESFTPDPKPAAAPESSAMTGPARGSRELRDLHKEAPPSQPAPAAARADAERARGQEEARSAVARSQRAAAEAPVGALAVQSPEQWLMGIDDLKRQGRHEEAEKQLAEFRKRYPNYRIPEAITEKFEKR